MLTTTNLTFLIFHAPKALVLCPLVSLLTMNLTDNVTLDVTANYAPY